MTSRLPFLQPILILTLLQHWSFIHVCLLIRDDHDTMQVCSGKDLWKETRVYMHFDLPPLGFVELGKWQCQDFA